MTDIQNTITQYLARSSGTANYPTEHTFRCFVGMIETGEATIEDFRIAGRTSGDWLVGQIEQRIKEWSK